MIDFIKIFAELSIETHGGWNWIVYMPEATKHNLKLLYCRLIFFTLLSVAEAKAKADAIVCSRIAICKPYLFCFSHKPYTIAFVLLTNC